MNELALFTGGGGGILGSRLLGFRTVCAVEIDPYCREILLRRQEEGHLEAFQIWDDARTFDGTAWRGAVDLVTAGFPCQPFSVAGKRKAELDERNLWPETIRIIREVRPRWCLLENVPGLLARSHGYFWTILGDLAESGFDARWDVISAQNVGANHLRKRLWIVAHASDMQRASIERDEQDGVLPTDVSDANSGRAHAESRGRPGTGGTNSLHLGGNGEVRHVADSNVKHGNGGRPESSEVCREQRQSSRLRNCESDAPDANGSGKKTVGGVCGGANTDAARDAPDTEGTGRRQSRGASETISESRKIERPSGCSGSDTRAWWAAEPDVGRVVDGLAAELDEPRTVTG